MRDPSDSWTVQQGPQPRTAENTTSYVVKPHQLPDPAVAREAGLPLQQIPPTIVEGGEEGLAGYLAGESPQSPDRIHGWTGESHDPDLFVAQA